MGLVHDFTCLGPKGILMPTPVVAAEEQVSASRENYSDIGLSIAAVTSIRRAEGRGGEGGGHLRSVLSDACPLGQSNVGIGHILG